MGLRPRAIIELRAVHSSITPTRPSSTASNPPYVVKNNVEPAPDENYFGDDKDRHGHQPDQRDIDRREAMHAIKQQR